MEGRHTLCTMKLSSICTLPLFCCAAEYHSPSKAMLSNVLRTYEVRLCRILAERSVAVCLLLSEVADISIPPIFDMQSILDISCRVYLRDNLYNLVLNRYNAHLQKDKMLRCQHKTGFFFSNLETISSIHGLILLA